MNGTSPCQEMLAAVKYINCVAQDFWSTHSYAASGGAFVLQ